MSRFEVLRKAALEKLLLRTRPGLQLNEHIDDVPGDVVFKHACELGLEGIVASGSARAIVPAALATG